VVPDREENDQIRRYLATRDVRARLRAAFERGPHWRAATVRWSLPVQPSGSVQAAGPRSECQPVDDLEAGLARLSQPLVDAEEKFNILAYQLERALRPLLRYLDRRT